MKRLPLYTAFFLTLVTALSCTSTPQRNSMAELRVRPSNPYFLKPGYLPRVPVKTLDADLTREVWKDGYRAVVTPLTAPLVARMAEQECLWLGYKSKDTQKIIKRLVSAFAASRSCFYVVLSLEEANVHTRKYEMSYSDGDGKKYIATQLPDTARTTKLFQVQNKILQRALPVSLKKPGRRNTLGFSRTASEILCGKKIDFGRPFSFSILPKGPKEKTPTATTAQNLGWTSTKVAE